MAQLKRNTNIFVALGKSFVVYRLSLVQKKKKNLTLLVNTFDYYNSKINFQIHKYE